MSMRLRRVDGMLVALCAVESDPMPDDIYLDDEIHGALADKFADDWHGQTVTWADERRTSRMATQKVRDAAEECLRWCEGQERRLLA